MIDPLTFCPVTRLRDAIERGDERAAVAEARLLARMTRDDAGALPARLLPAASRTAVLALPAPEARA